MSLLKRTQATYSTSYVEDCDALKAAAADGTAGGGDALSPRARLSLQFRRSQKKMLSLEMTRVSLEQNGPKKSARSEQTAALHTSLPRQEDHFIWPPFFQHNSRRLRQKAGGARLYVPQDGY